jgi:hypothetical protein
MKEWVSIATKLVEVVLSDQRYTAVTFREAVERQLVGGWYSVSASQPTNQPTSPSTNRAAKGNGAKGFVYRREQVSEGVLL